MEATLLSCMILLNLSNKFISTWKLFLVRCLLNNTLTIVWLDSVLLSVVYLLELCCTSSKICMESLILVEKGHMVTILEIRTVNFKPIHPSSWTPHFLSFPFILKGLTAKVYLSLKTMKELHCCRGCMEYFQYQWNMSFFSVQWDLLSCALACSCCSAASSRWTQAPWCLLTTWISI